MTRKINSNLKIFLLISLFYLLIFSFALFFLQRHSLNVETQQLLDKADVIKKAKEQDQPLDSNDNIKILDKATDNTATRAIQSGAKYFRSLSAQKITLTLPYNQEGQIQGYIVASKARQNLSFEILLLSVISASFYLIFSLAFMVYYLRNKAYRENLLLQINRLKEKPLEQNYLIFQTRKAPDELESALNQLGENLQKRLETQSNKKDTLYQFSELLQFPIFICDASGKIHYANQEFQRVFSVSSDIQVFSPYPDFLNYLIEHLLEQKNEQKSFYFEAINRYYSVEFFPLSHLAIERRFLFTMTDISYYQQALQSEKELLANISHELKTPLSSIRGFSEILIRQKLPETDQQHFIELIHQESQRLISFVSEVLQLSHSMKKISKAEVPLKEIFLEIIKNYQPRITEKELSLNMELEDFSYVTNEEKFYTIIKNLIENAVNYAPNKGKIDLQLQQVNGGVKISVQNSGTGLTALEKLHVFDRFYRSEAAIQSNPSGSGLGLAIVQKNVQDLGGNIQLESPVGEGVRFTVFL